MHPVLQRLPTMSVVAPRIVDVLLLTDGMAYKESDYTIMIAIATTVYPHEPGTLDCWLSSLKSLHRQECYNNIGGLFGGS